METFQHAWELDPCRMTGCEPGVTFWCSRSCSEPTWTLSNTRRTLRKSPDMLTAISCSRWGWNSRLRGAGVHTAVNTFIGGTLDRMEPCRSNEIEPWINSCRSTEIRPNRHTPVTVVNQLTHLNCVLIQKTTIHPPNSHNQNPHHRSPEQKSLAYPKAAITSV